jgi:uncharacterized Zn finger protein (UPF0148 family)
VSMSWEAREALAARMRARSYTCTKCGSPSVRKVDGKELGEGGFAGIIYRVCGACGHTVATKSRPPKADSSRARVAPSAIPNNDEAPMALDGSGRSGDGQ